MKRSWMGAGLLLLLLAGGLMATRTMGRIHDPIARDLTAAGENALGGNWEEALVLFQRASDSWQRSEVLRDCLSDHTPMEQIDSDFTVLKIYGRIRDGTAFATLCSATAERVTALGQAQKLLLHNFL